MINDLDETLKQLLIKKGAIDPAEVEIRFETPKREWSATILKPTINFYLYDVRENHELRATEWFSNIADNGLATRKKNPSRMNLSFLVTIWTNNIDDEHRLLWNVLKTLFRYPVIPDETLSGQLVDQVYPIETKTAQPDGLFSNPADFWTALDNEIKPSINYVVTLPLDLDIVTTSPITKSASVSTDQIDPKQFEAVPVAGKVYESGKPGKIIARARIVAKEARLTTETDTLGRYSFKNLNPGKYTIQVLTSGNKIKETSLTVPGSNYDLEV
jgi:hypothetical protein